MKLFPVKRKIAYLLQHQAADSGWYQGIRRWLIALSALGLAVVLVKTGTAYLAGSAMFSLNKIRITGCRITRPEQILSHAGIQKGMNLLQVNLAQTSTHLEQYPYINKAVVQRNLPDSLEIYVEERRPRAIIKLDGYYLLDESGEIFKKADVDERTYPVLTGFTTDTFYQDREGCLKIIRNALQLLGLIEKDKRFNSLQIEIAIDKTSGFTIRTAPERMEVCVGWEDFTEKIDSLWKIVDDLKSKGLEPENIKLKSPQKAYVLVKG